MQMQRHLKARRASLVTRLPIPFALAFLLIGLSAAAFAQSQASEKSAETKSTDAKPSEPPRGPELYQTLYLAGSAQAVDFNDVQTDLRNMLPRARIYGIPAQNAISLRGTAEEIQTAQKILAEMDRPRKVYRLTYTISETGDGRSAGARHFSLIVPADGKADLKQGSKVPIITGSTQSGGSDVNTQVQYLDIGLHIEASLEGTRLRTKVEESSLADEKSTVGVQDPIVRQTVFDGVSTLAPGKPLVLGSLDIPGGTRREEIQVAAEDVP